MPWLGCWECILLSISNGNWWAICVAGISQTIHFNCVCLFEKATYTFIVQGSKKNEILMANKACGNCKACRYLRATKCCNS